MKKICTIILVLMVKWLLSISCENPSIEKFVVAESGEIAPPEPPPMEELETIHCFTVEERQPEFPEGSRALINFIQSNIQYPNSATYFEGTVYVGFTVNKDGSLSDFCVKRGLHPDLDEEAIRVLKLMPNWIPGRQNGRLVNVIYTVPVKFKLTK